MLRGYLLLLLALLPGCLGSRVLGRVLSLPRHPKTLDKKLTQPARSDARLAVTFIGHATVLIQMDDRFILTDPVFTDYVGGISPRLVEPGIAPEDLPQLSLVAVSHLHLDHLSYDSLAMIEKKTQRLVLPEESLENLPRYAFEMHELGVWQSHEQNGLRVTAVPVRHVSGRWGLDKAWTKRTFTGYVFEYHGMSVYFGGDTVFDAKAFRSTARRFMSLDLALLPICPSEPAHWMRRAHMDPGQALDAYTALHAKFMLPIHFDTFINSDDRPGECTLKLRSEMSAREIYEDRVVILGIGEQRVFLTH